MLKQFASFTLDEIVWGLDILQIREVITDLEIFPVPQSPAYVYGVMNLRGQIVTVIDLAARLGRTPSTRGQRQTCIILKIDSELSDRLGGDELERVGSDTVGLLVDKMDDVLDVESASIDPTPPNTGGIASCFLRGVVRKDKDLMLVLRLAPLVKTGEVDE